jgi:hypothetical protein
MEAYLIRYARGLMIFFLAPWTDQQQKELQHLGEQRPSLGSGMHASSSRRAKSRSWPVLLYARRRGRGKAVAGRSGEIRRWQSTHGAEVGNGSAWAPQCPPVCGPCLAWPRRRWQQATTAAMQWRRAGEAWRWDCDAQGEALARVCALARGHHVCLDRGVA